jgi:hypothetical protein
MVDYYDRWGAPMQQPTKVELWSEIGRLKVVLAIERGRRRQLEHKLKQVQLVIEEGILDDHDGKQPPTWLATLTEESLGKWN